MKIISSFLLIITLLTTALSEDSGEVITVFTPTYKYDNLSLGYPKQSGTIVNREGYAFCYSEEHEQPLWVMYKLTKAEVSTKITERRDNFRMDPLIPTDSASLVDYKYSGYDRGHLAPTADMAWSAQAMSESFYLSNMSPQSPQLNRGRWRDLEALIRTWATENEELYVITGPIIRENNMTIGPNKVTVPQWYYKIVLDLNYPDNKAIAFIMPNKKCEKNIRDYAVTIDKIEEITGLDFFNKLADHVEDDLEAQNDFAKWEAMTIPVRIVNITPDGYLVAELSDKSTVKVALKGVHKVNNYRLREYHIDALKKATLGKYFKVTEIIETRSIEKIVLVDKSGVEVNELLLKSGNALYDYSDTGRPSNYQRLEGIARRAGRGLWAPGVWKVIDFYVGSYKFKAPDGLMHTTPRCQFYKTTIRKKRTTPKYKKCPKCKVYSSS